MGKHPNAVRINPQLSQDNLAEKRDDATHFITLYTRHLSIDPTSSLDVFNTQCWLCAQKAPPHSLFDCLLDTLLLAHVDKSEDQDGCSWVFAFKDHLLHHFYCKLSTATRFIWTRNSRLTSASPNVCLLSQPLDQVSSQHDPPDHLLYLANLHSHFHLKELIGSSWNILWVFVPWVNRWKAVKHHHNWRGYPPFPKNEIALRSLKMSDVPR